MSATVMYEDRVAVAQSALEDGAHLWLSVVDMESVTGWTLKAEGLCRAEACVALKAIRPPATTATVAVRLSVLPGSL